MCEGGSELSMNRTRRKGALTPTLSHPMGEGESSAVVLAIGRWSTVHGPDACAKAKGELSINQGVDSGDRRRKGTPHPDPPHPDPLPSDGRGRIVGSRFGNQTLVHGSWS